jgi:hypothetical protein
MSESIHSQLADGRWGQLSLVQQMGNIGSEFSRAATAQQQGRTDRVDAATGRCFELFDLTITDPRLVHRNREIVRAREVVADFFYGGNIYGSTAEQLNDYFNAFAIAARR